MRCRSSSTSTSRRPQQTRLTLTLVLLGAVSIAPLLLTSCGARTAEKESTNTGNPPFIDHGEIRIELVGDKVRVTGEAGAVTPGGAEVEVTNLSTDETAKAKAKANGAFEVDLAGELDDGYSVRITSSEGEANLTLSLGGSTDACTDREPTDSSLDAQCWALTREARCQAIEAVSPDLLECESSDDCERVSLSVSCNDFCNPSTALAKTAPATFRDALAEIDERVCGERETLGCPGMVISCDPGPPTLPVCVAGHCALVSGCIAGVRSANDKFAEQLPALAEGCSSDVDCRLESPSACEWGCPTTAYVSSIHQQEYESLLGEVTADCGLASAEGRTCQSVAMCPAAEANVAVCKAGTCVAGDSADLEDTIQAEIDRLNYCNEPEDCQAVAFPNCKTSYVNEEADQSTLDALLMSYPTTGCDGSCACGLLECIDNRCTTRAGDCMTAPEGALMTCL